MNAREKYAEKHAHEIMVQCLALSVSVVFRNERNMPIFGFPFRGKTERLKSMGLVSMAVRVDSRQVDFDQKQRGLKSRSNIICNFVRIYLMCKSIFPGMFLADVSLGIQDTSSSSSSALPEPGANSKSLG